MMAVLIIVFIIYITGYLAAGILWQSLIKDDRYSGVTVVSGMLAQSLVFFVIAIPMKLAKAPLMVTAVVWAVVWLALIVLCLLKCQKDAKSFFDCVKEGIKNNRILFVICVIVTIAEIVFVEIYGRQVGGANATYYIGYVTTAIHDGYLGISSPYTGAALKNFNSSYFLQTFLDHSAVVCRLFGLHPLLEVRSIIPAVMIIMNTLIVVGLAEAFFEKEYSRILFFVAYKAIQGIFASSQLLPSFYYYFRAFEGKGIYGTIFLPLFALLLYRVFYYKEKNAQWMLIIAVLSSFTYTMSALFTYPFILVGCAPLLIHKDIKKRVVNLVVLSIPWFLAAVWYLGIKADVISLVINR